MPLTPALKARVEVTFASVLAHPPPSRPAFLAEVCGDDDALLEEVRALLAAYESSGDFLDSLPEETANHVARIKPEAPGDVIGNYKLLQEIGGGGFGTVWMAEQEQPVRRRVALKILKLGMDTAEVIARFEQERQALAMMDHSNIAQVFDAGATQWGRPYFVMELVKGIPITEFCDRGELGMKARLRLFADVCSAINHAHQKGVIHRDIKPSNVMVTVHSEVPMVKIIDFGIAKATQGRLTDQTLFTRYEQFIGTPVYMSPEQAALSGLDIDTRSDIYSLGILLYELLTGTPPFDAVRLASAGYDEMRRMIREDEPQKPSARLRTTIGSARMQIARSRQVEPGNLRRLIESDLDWIVMKAIEKDRSRRYETANALAADIQRFLANEPVLARPPTIGYKFQKSWQRNRLAISAGAAVAIALIAGTGVALWQAHVARAEKRSAEIQSESARNAEARARKEADRAVKAEATALAESGRAKQTAEFLNRLLYHAAREIKKGRNPEALKLALALSTNSLAKLQDDPTLQSDLMERMARFYQAIGEWKLAQEIMESRLQLIARTHGKNSVQTHRYELTYLQFLDNYGARASVPAKLEKLRERVEAKEGRRGATWFEVQCELVRCWIKLRSNSEALAASAECMREAQLQNLTGDQRMKVALFREQALEAAEMYKEAEELLGECRERIAETTDQPKWREDINDRLLYLLEKKGDFKQGAALLRAEAAEGKTAGGENRERLVGVLRRLASFESRAKEHTQAIQHAQTALDLARALGAEPGPEGNTFREAITQSLRQLADCERAAKRHEDAIRHAREALSNAEEQGDLDEISKSLKVLAEAQVAAGQLDSAYHSYESRNAVREKSNINYRDYVYTLLEMSEIRLKQDRPDDAMMIAREMWTRSTVETATNPDPGHMQYIAKHGLKVWNALQKAQPGTAPPAEVVEWQTVTK